MYPILTIQKREYGGDLEKRKQLFAKSEVSTEKNVSNEF